MADQNRLCREWKTHRQRTQENELASFTSKPVGAHSFTERCPPSGNVFLPVGGFVQQEEGLAGA